MLIAGGPFRIKFREPRNDERHEIRTLRSAADYVIWPADVEHSWRGQGWATVLTVKWVARESDLPSAGTKRDMLADITNGNAAHDGAEFGHWFVGDFEKWCPENDMLFEKAKFRLRQATDLEMKWATHRCSESRQKGWTDTKPRWKTINTLVHGGPFRISFRDPDDRERPEDHVLRSLADYVIWREDDEHLWHAEGCSALLAIRWRDT